MHTCGTMRSMLRAGSATVSFLRLSTRLCASENEVLVTKYSHHDERRGVSTGTVAIQRL